MRLGNLGYGIAMATVAFGSGLAPPARAQDTPKPNIVQQQVAALAQTAIEYPPLQEGASFNLDAMKAQIEAAVKQRAGQ